LDWPLGINMLNAYEITET